MVEQARASEMWHGRMLSGVVSMLLAVIGFDVVTASGDWASSVGWYWRRQHLRTDATPPRPRIDLRTSMCPAGNAVPEDQRRGAGIGSSNRAA